MVRLWLLAGAANGLIAVAMGALAAHGLERQLDAVAQGWVRTASDYQMAHALALLAVAWLAERGGRWANLSGALFLAGTLLFSGGLYVMALAGFSSLGPLVPLGGIAYLAGWAALFAAGLTWSATRKR